jgi:hypothetical protein
MIRNFRNGNFLIQKTNAACRLVGALLALGCSSASDGTSSHDGTITDDLQARVTRILEMRGFDTTGIVFTAEDTVVVEEDIVMGIKDILAGESASIEKGYFHGTVVTPPLAIHLVNDPAAPISAGWQWAFFLAAGDWNAKTNNLSITGFGPQPPGAKVITLRKLSIPGPTIAAQGDFPPGNGNPGATITINSTFTNPGVCGGTSTTIENIPSSQALKTAIHELGHNLGLRHPAGGSEAQTMIHIPNTADAFSNPNYSSVMWQNCVGGKVAGTMTPDDQASAFVLGY